jgi:hypothetical protein
MDNKVPINGYQLSRYFWDYAFENTGKIKPIHVSIYFFAMEHCNRLGWKRQFGLPTSMVLEAISVKSYSVYKSAFDDLVKFGLFEVIQYSKNQYSSNIIALKENNKANKKALDKALMEHGTEQRRSTIQSNVSIDKQLNKEQITMGPIEEEFDRFWNLYAKKVDRPKCLNKWKSLKDLDKQKIFETLPKYVDSTPELKFRKNPSTYLNNRSWENEIPQETEQPRKLVQ